MKGEEEHGDQRKWGQKRTPMQCTRPFTYVSIGQGYGILVRGRTPGEKMNGAEGFSSTRRDWTLVLSSHDRNGRSCKV